MPCWGTQPRWCVALAVAAGAAATSSMPCTHACHPCPRQTAHNSPGPQRSPPRQQLTTGVAAGEGDPRDGRHRHHGNAAVVDQGDGRLGVQRRGAAPPVRCDCVHGSQHAATVFPSGLSAPVGLAEFSPRTSPCTCTTTARPSPPVHSDSNATAVRLRPCLQRGWPRIYCAPWRRPAESCRAAPGAPQAAAIWICSRDRHLGMMAWRGAPAPQW